jgi:hypothetical protein
MVVIPRCPIREGFVSDSMVQATMATYSAKSKPDTAPSSDSKEVSLVPTADKITKMKTSPHPPSPEEPQAPPDMSVSACDSENQPPVNAMTREAIRFLSDVAARPLSTTVSRYQRLNLSRRRGNAVRQSLAAAGIIEPIPIASRSGQVVLCQLTDFGRTVCQSVGIEPGPRPRASLEHAFWVMKAAEHFEAKSYAVTREHVINGNGVVDLLAERPGERVAVEVETGRSDIPGNLAKVLAADFDGVVLVATSPVAVTACQDAVASVPEASRAHVTRMTWLDL